jgi:membrane protease YdiL (CAAX protease family)
VDPTETPHPQTPAGREPLPVHALMALFGIGLLGVMLVGALAPAVLAVRPADRPIVYLTITTGGLLAVAVAVVALLVIILRRNDLDLSVVGLGSAPLVQRAMHGIRAYARILPLVIIALVAVHWLYDALDLPPPRTDVQKIALMAARSWLLAALFLVMTVVAAPVLEEVLFRGLLFTILRRRMEFIPAAIISAVGFAMLHDPAAWLPIAILGYVLARVYEETGSLVPAITAHAVHNALFFGLILLVRDVPV